ncbi:hypothetical protein EYC84_005841 [Monilinia fructicola]|uniref:Uncharacterized protein n=1 Tax=Monilinia fructicola TaxID=38448 RepID=A0A5M9K0D8_MONFR|nr:hypothetical protein EYC84_005841 [Monilinia fructicola]
MSSSSSRVVSPSTEQLKSWLEFIKTVPSDYKEIETDEEGITYLLLEHFEKWIEELRILDNDLITEKTEEGTLECRTSCNEDEFPKYVIQIQGTLANGKNKNLLFSFENVFPNDKATIRNLKRIEKKEGFLPKYEDFKALGSDLRMQVACRAYCNMAQAPAALVGQYERGTLNSKVQVSTRGEWDGHRVFRGVVWKLVVANDERKLRKDTLKQMIDTRIEIHGETIKDMFSWS